MAEGQRQRDIYPSFGASLLSTFTGKVSDQLAKRQEQEDKLRQLITAAFATEQAKAAFPNAEEQAKQEARQLIAQLNPEPSTTPPTIGERPLPPPELRFAPPPSAPSRIADIIQGRFQETPQLAERKAALQQEFKRRSQENQGLQAAYQGRVQAREAFLQQLQAAQQARRENVLQMMSKHGLLPKAPLSLEDITAQARARTEGTGSQEEKSYEVHSKSIDQYQKPVDERLDRLSRLQDTINQQTPQADALVAPELLTVMAGGQASGLRMNEAEIARIVGGRTNLEGLKAALNKWQVNPNKGLSITPAQRQQVRDLVNTVQDKLSRKSEILNTARQQLIDANTSLEHRTIVSQMRRALQEVDTGLSLQSRSEVPSQNAEVAKARLRAKYGR